MNESERRDRIIKYLEIKPISHGQIYTFQIAIPESEVGEIPPQRREDLRRSLTEQGSNLIPLIVRRTEAYSELEEYEVVYGADWCIVAKELDIEKLWVWVFDMTDEQAGAAKIQMEQLVGSTVLTPAVISSISDNTEQKKILPEQLDISVQEKEVFIEEVNVTKQEDAVPDRTDQIKCLLQQVEKSFQEVEAINRNIEQLSESVKDIKKVLLEQKETIRRAIDKTTPPPQKLNLLQAEDQEIDKVLQLVGVKDKERKAALTAIKKWKQPGKKLTWENLKKSTKSGSDKIPGFAKATYEKLEQIVDITD